jgi:hypothetical protein
MNKDGAGAGAVVIEVRAVGAERSALGDAYRWGCCTTKCYGSSDSPVPQH